MWYAFFYAAKKVSMMVDKIQSSHESFVAPGLSWLKKYQASLQTDPAPKSFQMNFFFPVHHNVIQYVFHSLLLFVKMKILNGKG